MAGRKYAAYQNKYREENVREFRLKINRQTEPELLEWMNKQENYQGYLKSLIRNDIESRRKEENAENNR
ncbi:MAG: hypothetical protein IJF98_07490 [Firmicutes bacterium]|nr:hypothetical protein [Bacillota bacterium]